ncbi:MAG TPA: cyclopropane-fatty-acyl-phospholipid synthase family protein [Gammaproteobacteria bacterium]|nr:cyclopropane-fatty-acyl-phospholipid synthase family protein [Gammaproteobacteria bacterium]
MNRSRLEPLGVPESDYGFDEAEAARREPSALDRWLAKQITKRLGESPVKVALWDEPDAAPRDGIVRMRILDRKALWQIIVNPDLHFGDLYSSGRLEVRGELLTLLREAYRYTAKHTAIGQLVARGRKLAPDLSDSKRNIHHHYDIGNQFYELWLDREALQYTCAYFADAAMTIEQAQQAKMHHVCRKLELKAGERVVEAGGGWGGFALFMAKNYGARVRSFNISEEQIAYSRAWAKRLGLDSQVEFIEDDYRNLTGTYDAFVSIGMLEHVGKGNYKDLGALMARALTPTGRGLVHSIGRDTPALMNAWIDKRIFPGAYPPTLREMMDLFEPNGLSVLDVENIRLHYAKTLEWWLQRYEENVDAVRDMFDETFVRAWRLYLTGSIAAFLNGTLQLFQVLYARHGAKNVPWTRAHVYRDHP